jgi:hypothetical protein
MIGRCQIRDGGDGGDENSLAFNRKDGYRLFSLVSLVLGGTFTRKVQLFYWSMKIKFKEAPRFEF